MRCPQGTRVVGGGVDTTDADKDIEVAATFPFDGPDDDETADDGWEGRMNNDPSNDPGIATTMKTFAICLD